MSRRESRESAFKLLYQMEIQKQDFQEQKVQFITDQNIKENELEYFNMLIEGVTEMKSEIDDVYSQHLKKWNLDRIAKIDQTILRIATYEIIHVPMVPFNVSVSEAVYLSKKYSTDEARSFINGILGNLNYLKPFDENDTNSKDKKESKSGKTKSSKIKIDKTDDKTKDSPVIPIGDSPINKISDIPVNKIDKAKDKSKDKTKDSPVIPIGDSPIDEISDIPVNDNE